MRAEVIFLGEGRAVGCPCESRPESEDYASRGSLGAESTEPLSFPFIFYRRVCRRFPEGGGETGRYANGSSLPLTAQETAAPELYLCCTY